MQTLERQRDVRAIEVAPAVEVPATGGVHGVASTETPHATTLEDGAAQLPHLAVTLLRRGPWGPVWLYLWFGGQRVRAELRKCPRRQVRPAVAAPAPRPAPARTAA